MRRGLALILCSWCACATSDEKPRPSPTASTAPSPTLEALDRWAMTTSEERPSDESVAECLRRAERQSGCGPATQKRRTIALRLVLDERYAQTFPNWQQRLNRTLRCVNQLYRSTLVQWEIRGAQFWDPGEQRHDLYALLGRIRREYSTDNQSLLVGITAWSEERVFSGAAGEIGLSQGDSCVVPSWPRIENDCLILAHELGHLTGAVHVPGKNWIMSWSASPFHLPAQDAIARVTSTFRFHPRNIAAINAHSTARYSPYGLQPTAACQKRIEAINACWSL